MPQAIDEGRLATEAEFLHQRLFGDVIPDHVRRRYVDAHRHLDVGARSVVHVDVDAIVGRRIDAESIELYARLRDPMNPLTQKFRILGYLVEIEAGYYHRHVRESGGLISSLPGLVWAVVRSGAKLAKGAFLGHSQHVL